MTKEQKKAVRKGIRTAGRSEAWSAWDDVIRRTREHYAKEDPVCAELLELRYLDGLAEDEVIRQLYIGRTTYYRKELELLSTIAVFAAQMGLI